MKVFAKIDPCPINEAIMEVRFESDFDEAAVFGIIYNEIKDEFTKTADLPVLQLPANLRKRDKNLIHQPYYRLTSKSNKNKLIQIGPRVFSVILTNDDYPGWNTFIEDINYGLEKLQKSNIVKRVTRLALRYLNFFEGNILMKSNLSITLNENSLNDYKAQLLRLEIPDGDFMNALSIDNNVLMRLKGELRNGSLIDIDTYLEGEMIDFFDRKSMLLHECHQAEKRLFSSLFNSEYLNSLKEVKYE